jgi:C-terminal processing protease CtpA/Prc
MIGVAIAETVVASPAAVSGHVFPGDVLKAINDQDVRQMHYEEVGRRP